MPPKKSTVSATSNGAEDGAESTPARGTKDGLSVEDLSLPKSMVARLAKGVLPANTQIHKDALLALHKSATVFVNYIASTSNENAQASGKKTIMPPDVMAALKDAEYEDFLPRCEAELKKYNDIQCDKRNTYRRKVKEDKAATEPPPAEAAEAAKDGEVPEVVNGATNGHASIDDLERPAKKLKGEDGQSLQPDQEDLEDEGPDAEQANAQDDADDQDDDTLEEAGEDEEELENEDGEDETMEDPTEEPEERGELRDEALDEPDSD